MNIAIAGPSSGPNLTQSQELKRYLSLSEEFSIFGGLVDPTTLDDDGEDRPAIATINFSESAYGSLTATIELPKEGDGARIWLHVGSDEPISLKVMRRANQLQYRFDNDSMSTPWVTLSQSFIGQQLEVTLTADEYGLTGSVHPVGGSPTSFLTTYDRPGASDTTHRYLTMAVDPQPLEAVTRYGKNTSPGRSVATFNAEQRLVYFDDIMHYSGQWAVEAIESEATPIDPNNIQLAKVLEFKLATVEIDARSPAEIFVDSIVDKAAAASQTSIATSAFQSGVSPSLWTGNYVADTSFEEFLEFVAQPASVYQATASGTDFGNDQYATTTISLYAGTTTVTPAITPFCQSDTSRSSGSNKRYASYDFPDNDGLVFSFSPFSEYVFRTADIASQPPIFGFSGFLIPDEVAIESAGAIPLSVSNGATNPLPTGTEIVGISIDDNFGQNFSNLGHDYGIRTTISRGQSLMVGAAVGQASGETIREQWSDVVSIVNRFTNPASDDDGFGGSDDRDFSLAIQEAAIEELTYHSKTTGERVAAATSQKAVWSRPSYIIASSDYYTFNGQILSVSDDPQVPERLVPQLPLYFIPDDFALSTVDMGLSAIPIDGTMPNMTAGAGLDAGLAFAHEIAFKQEELVGRLTTEESLGPWSRLSERANSDRIIKSIGNPGNSTQSSMRDRLWNPTTHSWDTLDFGYDPGSFADAPGAHDRYGQFGTSVSMSEWENDNEENLLRRALIDGGYVVLTPVVHEELGYYSPGSSSDSDSDSDPDSDGVCDTDDDGEDDHDVAIVPRYMTAYRSSNGRLEFEHFVVAKGRILGGAFQAEFFGLQNPDLPPVQGEESVENTDGLHFDKTVDYLGSRTANGSTNLSSGESAPMQTDVILPNIGPDIAVIRRHALDGGANPNLNAVSDFGDGWTHSYSDVLLVGDGLQWITSTGTKYEFGKDQSAAVRGWSLNNIAGNQYEMISDTKEVWRFAADPSDTDTADGQTKYHLIYHADRFGNAVHIVRDNLVGTETEANVNRRITRIQSQPSGGVAQDRLVFQWDGSFSHIAAVTDDAGRRWQYDYDGAGRLSSVTQPPTETGRAGRQTYLYSTAFSNRVQSISHDEVLLDTKVPPNALGNRRFSDVPSGPRPETAYQYYGDGRLAQSLDAGGGITTLLINPWLGRRYTIDERGNISTHLVSSIGQTTRMENPRGDAMRNDYDIYHQTLDQTIDTLGGITSFEYDDIGNRTTVVEQSGLRHEFTFDPVFQQPTSYFRGSDIDSDGKLIVTSVENYRTTWNIEAATGLTLAQTDPLGRITRFEYDDRGQLRYLTTPRGESVVGVEDYRTEYQYDDRGLIVDMYEADPDLGGPLLSPHWQFEYRDDGVALKSHRSAWSAGPVRSRCLGTQFGNARSRSRWCRSNW